ncbi:MAG: ATP-binding protein [Nostocaceae cyanobacterium]|nr:ATP-binding protein [Nostocaceae cyanobacterium]
MTNDKLSELELFFQLSLDLLCVAGLDGYFKRVNPAFERTLGYSPEELLSQPFIAFVHPDDKASTLAEVEKLATGSPTIYFENRYCCKNGEYKWLDWTAFPLLEKGLLYAIARDVTEKKHLESQLLRTQRLESIGTLASGISHDLNNILTPILAIAQLLYLKFPDTDVRTQRMLKILEDNAKRGAELIKQILSFTRGIEGKHTILSIQHLIREIEQIIRETFPKSIDILTDVSPDLWLVSADATQLHQVLMNLCVNARDAMPDGGKLTISVRNFVIDKNYAEMNLDAKVGSYIVVEVTDTGRGIPAEELDKIFDPFFTTKARGKGTGLGLSTVIGIVKSHGGFIDVNSKVGKGSEFKFYLPAVIGYEHKQLENEEFHQGEGELILVADDESAIRDIIKTSLETYNYQVITASDGIDAIALYAEHQNEIKLVLVDMMMPMMDGTITIKTLQKINNQVNIIAMSGLASSKLVCAANEAGVKKFLSKPFTTNELLQALCTVLHPDHCQDFPLNNYNVCDN